MQIAQANLVIYVSPNGRDDWTPVLPHLVPDWLKEPDRMAHLVDGEMASKCDDPMPVWYRAEVVQ